MDKKTRNKIGTTNSSVWGMIIGGALIFVSSLLFVPQAGVIRSFPFSIFVAGISYIFYKNILFNTACSFIFSFCLMRADGTEILDSAVLSLLFAFVSLLFGYASMLIKTALKSKSDKDTTKKCFIRGIVCAVISIVIYTLMCGNMVSACLAKKYNSDYIKSNYGKDIDIDRTCFDPLTRQYNTYVRFKNDGQSVGDKNDCFVSKTTDKIRDFHADLILEDGEKKLIGILTNAVDMLEITAKGIEFDKNEPFKKNSVYSDYGDRAWFVVSLYHEVRTKEQFSKLCNDCIDELAKHDDFSFGKIIICGGNSSNVLYTLTLNSDDFGEKSKEDIVPFDEKYLEQYGVTEKSVLDYWYNR